MNNLTIRILSALAILPPVLALIFLAPPWGFALVAVAVAAIAGWEFGNITFGGDFPRMRILLAGVSAGVAATVAFSTRVPGAPLVALILTIPLILTAFMVAARDMKKTADAAAFAATGALYTGALFGAMALIVSTPSDDSGRYWFLTLLAGTIFNDTLAYTFGRLFGRRKMAPTISPKKTWAGAVGGVLGTVAAVAGCRLLFLDSLSWWQVPILGVGMSMACQVGDLVESFIKRGFGVKDSGRIIPGHGGVLDRCDALMFAAPVVLLFVMRQ